MTTAEHRSIQDILCYWITFLSEALPPRARSTFIELLIGSLLTRQGFVTESLLAIVPKLHWTAYYKWIEREKWSWVALARQYLRLVLATVKPTKVYLAIDDTLTLRASEKAPGAKIHHQHGNKKNLAQYVLGQCWVSLAMITHRADGTPVGFPLQLATVKPVNSISDVLSACPWRPDKPVTPGNIRRGVVDIFRHFRVDDWWDRKCRKLTVPQQHKKRPQGKAA